MVNKSQSILTMIPALISGAVFLCSISSSSASYAMEPATVHPSHPNHCYNKETNKYHEDGDSWPIKGCGIASCIKINKYPGNPQFMISYEGCGSVGYDSPCYTTEDKNAEYPDCCPEVMCPDSNEMDYQDPYSNEITPEFIIQRNETNLEEVFRRHISNQFPRENANQWGDEKYDIQSLDSENEISDEDIDTRKASPRLFYLY